MTAYFIKYLATAKFILLKKQSVVLWKWCKSTYVKEVIKHSKTLFSNKRIPENSNRFLVLYFQPVNVKLSLKLSGKNVSYYITRILSMEGSHLWIVDKLMNECLLLHSPVLFYFFHSLIWNPVYCLKL